MKLLQLNSEAVFFDLDGTLCDTSYDLLDSLNLLLMQHGRPTLTLNKYRACVGGGIASLIYHGFDIDKHHPRYNYLAQRFLNAYQINLTNQTRLFPRMDTVLLELEHKQIPWGIVTNKPEWLAEPLVKHLQLEQRISCLITPQNHCYRKPSPLPLIYASQLTQVNHQQCIYIGDTRQDIQAANAAGMMPIAVSYGYHWPSDPPQYWGAQHTVNNVYELQSLLQQVTAR